MGIGLAGIGVYGPGFTGIVIDDEVPSLREALNCRATAPCPGATAPAGNGNVASHCPGRVRPNVTVVLPIAIFTVLTFVVVIAATWTDVPLRTSVGESVA
jgi:hypothetical protein